ncbi:aspartate/glutamate racemase family protein [Acuticoccus sp. I52.16.1]|uniref:aspartate/glutamate racemase family protein n=1 Tax=Acuticoccus sp. I52.16.1 TaxID=2928472 RepID=UPI001FD2B247|nr:aspartate/glutamate racemase family protein [Acuticoccus sp. I52.16.1]UOM35231.1 aspartate/glutamate racemase family protein [Acuticoccus sp. I52.16.1]
MRIALVNPNTSAATTAAMVAIAQEAAGDVPVRGLTAPFGAPLITEPAALAVAAEAVASLAPDLAAADAVIVAAFGDPGLDALRARLASPVTGLAEAGMAEAAAEGRRFAVVTTTPDLAAAIAAIAARYGHRRFAGTWLTPGDAAARMADPDALVVALGEACRAAVEEGGAEAIVIGGGPLAQAARALAGTVGVPLIEPVPAAVRLSLTRLASVDRGPERPS